MHQKLEATSSIEDMTIAHLFNFGSSIQQHSDSTHVLTVCCGPNGTSTLKISVMISDITDIYWSASNGKRQDSKLEIRYGLKNNFKTARLCGAFVSCYKQLCESKSTNKSAKATKYCAAKMIHELLRNMKKNHQHTAGRRNDTTSCRTGYDCDLGPGTVVILRIHLGSSIQQHLNKWNLPIGWSSEQRRPTWRDANINGTLMFSTCVKWQRMMTCLKNVRFWFHPTKKNMCIESYLQDIA